MAQEQQPQIQLSLDPNSYAVTNVNIGSDEEMFYLSIASGNQMRQFAASPKHTKRIYLLLKQQIENYEKKFGELKTKLPNPNKPQETKEETNLGF